MSLPIFEPLPVPPFELPERVQQIRSQADQEAAARAAAGGSPSPDTTPGSEPNRRSTEEPVQAPVPARVLVLVEGQVQEWAPERSPTVQDRQVRSAPAR
jgi:hypothetical protein